MGLRKSFETKTELEVDGVWQLVDANSRVKLARAGGKNALYAKTLERKTRPYRRQVATSTFDQQIAKEILRDMIIETVVKAWQTKVDGKWVDGIALDDGAPVPITKELLQQTFDEMPDLLDAINSYANDLGNFQQAGLDADAGN